MGDGESIALLVTRVHGIVSEHVGSIVAGAALEHCCSEMGIRPVELSVAHLPRFADLLQPRLAPFLGEDAGAVVEKIRNL